MGGSNQSLFIIGALLAGQGSIPGQGSAGVPLLFAGLLLSWAAAPGWTELVLLSPGRVGGISAACSDAFRPYSPILSALAATCYWWGWVPTCGLTAILAASALHQWAGLPIPVNVLAIGIIAVFCAANLAGLRWVARLAVPIALSAAALAFLSAAGPIVAGSVDWRAATSFSLTTPFGGWFGTVTSLMAGLYLTGFAAPAFEAATCHAGETIDPVRNVPRAMFASAAVAGVYFVALPMIWLGALGPGPLAGNLALELGPTFAPWFGAAAKAMAAGFLTFNMFAGTLQPLAGASRTLSQLADDGIFPRVLGRRSARDVPWVATLATAAAAIGFLFIGDPIWLIAAANFAYLIAIALPSIAVWLLRRDAPELPRPYRAPRGTIALGLGAAVVWTVSAVFGFEQFGLPTVLLGFVLASSGAALYAWRKFEDRLRAGLRGIPRSLHLTLTAAMAAVLLFDGAGYLIAIDGMHGDAATIAALQDIFVIVALLTIGAGLVLPGVIAQGATRELGIANATLRRGTEALEREIVERKSAQERLVHVALHDELTGLANRALFMERFEAMIANARPGEARCAAVLFLDIDRFKRVNDSLGHLAGDLLLVAVARRLERCLRGGDTLARFGGDEFTILLENIGGTHDAAAVAERILAELKAPLVVAGRDMYASVSIGIALTTVGADRAEDVLRDADIAMYRAKDLGKQRFEVFAPELHARAVAVLQLENDLKRALERREFALQYQPIVSLESGDLRGFEALIRWHHPERGLVPPNDFIPQAEESGAILAIGAWVIEEACRQAAIWRDAAGGYFPLAINVNVSAKQFVSSGLLDHITQALARYRLDSANLHVEITESAIMSCAETATETLVELRRMGVEVQLDDFGTGYSSLGYLHRFPVAALKIDRSFVSTAGPGIANVQIVHTITSLARSLGMQTTAEGVETPEQFEALRAVGCTNAQGFYLSRPLCAADAGRMVELFCAAHAPARRAERIA
jgi:diguanylate cyclase (GGDEF)-like protein